MKNYVIGFDYGTDSVRAVLVDTGSGEDMATNTFYYPQWQDKNIVMRLWSQKWILS